MKTNFCFGCGRTRDEIAEWTTYSDETREDIIKNLHARLDTVERKPRKETRRQKMARERGESVGRPTAIIDNNS